MSGASWPVGLRVLCVDDCDTTLKIVSTMLQKCGYEVSTVTNGQDALRMLKDRTRPEFDLVLSDVMMPDMDGFRLLELIGLEMGVPVIMMSSNGETSTVLRGVTHGAVDFLIKPVRLEELRNLWQHVIRRRKDQVKEDSEDFSLGERDGEPGCESSKKRKELENMEDGMDRGLDDDGGANKKARVVWSVEMHGQFVNAVNQLGVDKAVPKKILEIMQVDGLTRENVASHLQKYRLYLKRVASVTASGMPIGMMPGLVASPSIGSGAPSNAAGPSNHQRSALPGSTAPRNLPPGPGSHQAVSGDSGGGVRLGGGGGGMGTSPVAGGSGGGGDSGATSSGKHSGGTGSGGVSVAGGAATSAGGGGLSNAASMAAAAHMAGMFPNPLLSPMGPMGLSSGMNPLLAGMGGMGGSMMPGAMGMVPGLGQGPMPMGMPGMPMGMPFMQGMGMTGILPGGMPGLGNVGTNPASGASTGGSSAPPSRQTSNHLNVHSPSPVPGNQHHQQQQALAYSQMMLQHQLQGQMSLQQQQLGGHAGMSPSTSSSLALPAGFPNMYGTSSAGLSAPAVQIPGGPGVKQEHDHNYAQHPRIAGPSGMGGIGTSLGSLGVSSLGLNGLSLQSPTSLQQEPGRSFSQSLKSEAAEGHCGLLYVGEGGDTAEMAAALEGLYHDSGGRAGGPSRAPALPQGHSALGSALDSMLDEDDTGDGLPKGDLLGDLQNMDDLLDFFKE